MKCPIQSGMRCPTYTAYCVVGVDKADGRRGFNSGDRDAKLCLSNELKSK